jgi:hypothetical protein
MGAPLRHSSALSAFRYAPQGYSGSPGLRGGLAPRVLGSLWRPVARLDALSPHHPLSAFLGAPADRAGQGATLLTASIRFRPSPGDSRHRIGRWMEWAHQSQRFLVRRLHPAAGLPVCLSGPVRTIHSRSLNGPATPNDREEARRITAAFRRPAGTSEQTRSPGVRWKPLRPPTLAALRWELFPLCSRAWPWKKFGPFAARRCRHGSPERVGVGRDKKKQSFVAL